MRGTGARGTHSGVSQRHGVPKRRTVARRGRTARTAVPAVLVLLVAGCSAGPAQSYADYLRISGNGAEAHVGDIAIRDAAFDYDTPLAGGVAHRRGADVDLRVTVVNEGRTEDRLVAVRSPVAGSGSVSGERVLPAGQSLTAGYTEPEAAAAVTGTRRVRLRLSDLTVPIREGRSYPVEFVFARAGTARTQVALESSEVPREYCPLPPNGKPPRVLSAPIGRAPVPPEQPPPHCSSLMRGDADVDVIGLARPLLHPVWDGRSRALFGFVERDGRRLVRVDPESGEVRASRAADSAGENIALVAGQQQRIALPLPDSGRVALLDPATLEEVGSVPAHRPSRVAVQEGSAALFALSADHSTVTGIDPVAERQLFRKPTGEKVEALETGAEQDGPSYWRVTSSGVAYFARAAAPRPVGEHRAELSHRALGTGRTASEAYLVEEGSGRVELLRATEESGLESVVSNELDSVVEHLEADPRHGKLYAVTANEVITLAADTLEVVSRTEYRSTLGLVRRPDAKVSDVSVGEHFLYLAVEGEPFVLRVGK